MGQFSWIYSDTNRQLKDDVYKDTYLLIPEEFRKNTERQFMKNVMTGMVTLGIMMCMN